MYDIPNSLPNLGLQVSFERSSIESDHPNASAMLSRALQSCMSSTHQKSCKHHNGRISEKPTSFHFLLTS